MKIALAQYNPIIGDIEGNVSKITDFIGKAKERECDLVVFPELGLTGYPPRDLLLNQDFIRASNRGLNRIVSSTDGIGVIIGTIAEELQGQYLYNSAILIENGVILDRTDKSLLPNYDVFEEARYFRGADKIRCLNFRGRKLGITVCEDIWNDENLFGVLKYSRDILGELYEDDPDIFINLSASPYYYGKHQIRRDMISRYSTKYQVPFVYVNQVGGNDELVFDGSSMVYDNKGQLIIQANSFEEDLVVYDTEKAYPALICHKENISWLYQGLVLGTGDYFRKLGFGRTLLGLSGGVDSALAAYIAAEALGSENVLGVFMPTRYTSDESREDARDLAENLGIEYREIQIEDIFQKYLHTFNNTGETHGDLAEENIQARIRGNILMFIANREGRVLISPSNKSEIAVGYSTLYGDSCGGLAVIGDVLKTNVYELCKYINRYIEIIPKNIIVKAPTAELRPDQRDEDSLPPYSVLDGVLQMYIEENQPPKEIIQKGYDRKTVYEIINMVNKSEHKRRQIPPAIKVSHGGFGLGRRHPLVHGFIPRECEK